VVRSWHRKFQLELDRRRLAKLQAIDNRVFIVTSVGKPRYQPLLHSHSSYTEPEYVKSAWVSMHVSVWMDGRCQHAHGFAYCRATHVRKQVPEPVPRHGLRKAIRHVLRHWGCLPLSGRCKLICPWAPLCLWKHWTSAFAWASALVNRHRLFSVARPSALLTYLCCPSEQRGVSSVFADLPPEHGEYIQLLAEMEMQAGKT